MKKIRAITFPKSGVHLLSEILIKYFSNNARLPLNLMFEPRTEPLKAGKMIFCSKDHHCQVMPCPNSDVTYQIGHGDHVPMWKENDGINYIFQMRNPIYSTIAMGSWNGCSKKRKNWTEKEYYCELVANFKWWKLWIDKWVIGHEGPNVLNVVYEDLVKDPMKKMQEIVKYIEPETEPDKVNINNIIKKGFLPDINGKIGISFKHKIEEWIMYDKLKEQLKELEESVSDILELLNIPKVEWK